jgi:hypothetical protein
MAYAIMRWSKIQTATQAAEATARNYHYQDESRNEGPTVPHPNLEFVNVGKQDYWDLATARIAAAGIPPRRAGMVRCLEVIITASPEWFERNPGGRVVDYSQSAWLKDTRTFLIEKFGEQNLVAFQIQQGDKSPHVHAVVVPITSDGRLSVQKLFNPVTLRGYQSQYAERMKAHGLGRSI